MLVARSKTDFVFIFFILGTFLVLKGGWGTPKVGLVQKTIGKVIGRCVGNLGNIACTSNPNNGQGHQNAQGLAAMRIAQPKLAAFWTFWILGLAQVLVCCNGAQCKFMLCFGPRRERM